MSHRPDQMQIRAGASSYYSGRRTDEGEAYSAAQIVIHPDYEMPTSDIALIEIDGTFDFGFPGIGTIDLITEQEVALGYQDFGVTAYSTGWGDLYSGGPNPDLLQMVTAPIVDYSFDPVSYTHLTLPTILLV